MDKEVKYIGFYDFANNSNERVSALSGTNKMDYISEALIKAGFKVNIVSPSWGVDNIIDKNNLKSKDITIDDNKSVTLFPTLKTGKGFFKPFKILYSLTYLFFWLLFNVKKNERILVYHSPSLSFPLLAAKALKSFSIVLEVEEVYAEVWTEKKSFKKWEWRLINAADYYICASDLLAQKLGVEKSFVVYGSYKLPEFTEFDFKNPGVNLVYAGSIDTVKGGVFKAIESMTYLNEDYYLQICGYGSDQQVKSIVNLIKKTNHSLGSEACIFHGKLLGDAFSNLLNSCDIALNPQIEGDYMTTAFPSKILTYLSHNLHVLSTNIESIKASVLAPHINFTKNDSPLEIAKTIQNIDIRKRKNNSKLIKNMEDKLIEEMKKLFY